MLFTIMSNVSQRFARVPTSRKKVFKNSFYLPDDVLVRSGPFVIPKLDDTQLNSTSEDNYISAGIRQYPKRIQSHLLPLRGKTMKATKSPIPDPYSPNHPLIPLINQYAPKDLITLPSEMQITPQEKINTISFYIKDLKGFGLAHKADFVNSQKKKYKSVDTMYKALRAQILDYIKSKDGIVKRDQGLMSENGMGDVGKLDVSFQRILDGAEDFLNSMILNKLNKNLTKFDIGQTASLVEDNEPPRKVAQERSPAGYNETYTDDSEEDSPETQELVESLNHLPLEGDDVYGHTGPSSTSNGVTKTHRFSDYKKRYTKDWDNRLRAPKKKSNTLLSENLIEKVTDANYDPVELGDQELSDAEVTESVEDTPCPSEIIRSDCNLQDSKAVDKQGQEDEALNKKIDQRICNALDLLRNALMCVPDVNEGAFTSSFASSLETSGETFTQDIMMGVSYDPPVEEELTCIPTTCPTTTKLPTKEHVLATTRLIPKKTSTSQSIRKSVKPSVDNGTKSTREIRKSNPTKSIISKRPTPQRESNRRNAIKYHMSKKRMKNSGASERKDSLSDYEKVFGTKHSRLAVSQKAIKSKSVKVTKVSKPSYSKPS